MDEAEIDGEKLAEEQEIALGYMGRELRAPFAALLAFDQRLGRIVAHTSEPMLGQMRLAWWRDMLGTPVEERPRGDVVLEALSAHWTSHEAALVRMVDGWEYLLGEPPLESASVESFISGRIAPFIALGGLKGTPVDTDHVASHIRSWALADLLYRTGDPNERDAILSISNRLAKPADRLPAPLRGIAVLGALGLRAIAQGGSPLMEGRGAALTALRAGLIGR